MWVVKHLKSEIKPSAKMGIELNPIVKTRQVKLRKPLVREPTVVTNPVHPHAPRRPRTNNHRLMLALLYQLLNGWPIFILKSDHRNFESLTSFKALKSKFVWGKKGLFDMNKVFPLTWWKKEKLSERENFSDEDSDEEDSDYEEFVVPKKKQAKRKREANEAASPKRFRSPQTIKFASKRRQFHPRCQTSDHQERNTWHRWIRHGHLFARRQSDLNRINRSHRLSLLEDNPRGDQLNVRKNSHGGNPFWAQKRHSGMLAVNKIAGC